MALSIPAGVILLVKAKEPLNGATGSRSFSDKGDY
jgi:hypothetical protein